MAPWYVAIILGIVEGLTEFLPISSTGHLIIAGHLLNFTGPKAETFEIVIQLGAILAVVVLYWDRFVGLLFPDKSRKFSGVYGLWLLFLTSLPASVLGLLTHHYIKEYLFSPFTVAVALAVGAVLIFVVEGMDNRSTTLTLDEITPKTALGIGLFQCLALWPGFSRSASTIMGGMLLGAKRTVAAEYSFIAAVPIMFAATGYDFLKNYALFETGDLIFLLIGFVVSFIAAWLAVKGFIVLLGRLTLRPFAVYRIALAALILLFL
ncbi:Undecaprenyl-diphosphatase [Pseudodesulfovibrio hydrargyri]|uniref:Undecaprenyl-diphosphatase n=1 Tax=Pseudodesulfovibrio hydrargyri TaxID=2125990 RepID=A0A1J5N6L3_9BACT|nr:undecaprenyl-diphosphate phosphatase [Pseudodesulfovibrio hydrargyri]OIQ48943.1 Undecaprenyl-diphosphatase [Pseudodesulfovibrio hydrargyri]